MNDEKKSTPSASTDSFKEAQDKKQQNRRKPPYWKKKGSNTNNGNGNNGGNNGNRRPKNNDDNGKRKVNSSNSRKNNNTGGPKNNQSYRHNNSKNHSPNKTRFIDVYTSDFAAMHERCIKMGFNLPIKYKVHKPKALQHKLEQGTLRYLDSPTESNQTPDGMMVRPDTKQLPFVFLGTNTSLLEFTKNPRETERKLQEQINYSFAKTSDDGLEQVTQAMAALSTNATTTTLVTRNETIMKFACAADLLEDEPNGFACVASFSDDTIARVRDFSRALASRVTKKASDHGDFVVSLPQELLWEFLQANNKKQTASKARPLSQVQDDVLSRMAQQGVDTTTSKEEPTKLKFGHHLESLLHLMMQDPSSAEKKKKTKGKNPNAKQEPTSRDDPSTTETGNEKYMLIYGFNDSTDSQSIWELNIPGGKRALGETSVQAAMRETEEEISLEWTEEWVTNIYQNKTDPSLKMNRYYLLHPPDVKSLKVS